MAFLTYGPGLKLSQAEQFQALYGPGQLAPVTGIYQCQGCGFEIIRTATKLLQARNDRGVPRHPQECPKVSWRLVAQVDERPTFLREARAATTTDTPPDDPSRH